mmetsp:Transcript_37478/g.74336  ORF Transcript_37478/g.74336 Transcript_37478/m.74336 type:complete len:209 (-) Transcript_37478:112-738(-)
MRSSCALVALAAVLPLSNCIATTANCTSGLTISGLSRNLDGDYIQCDNSGLGGDNFCWHGEPHGLFLTHGCMACNETDQKLVEHTWAIQTIPDVHYPAVLHAVCTEGCPDTGRTWPLAAMHLQTKWMIIGQEDVVSNVRAGCCKQKFHRCDACDYKKCEGYGFSECLAHSIFPGCCSLLSWLPHGTCSCQQPPLECDHLDDDAPSLQV